jgi:carbamoyltransferase
MKLLSVMMTAHDCNMSYFDGEVVKYHKTERLKQKKRHAWDNNWEWANDIKSIWNVTPQEIDEIAVCLSYETDMTRADNPSDLITGKYFPATELNNLFLPESLWPLDHPNVWFMNHHFCHSLSTWMLSDQQPDVAIVIDGLGDFKTWSVFKRQHLIASGDIRNGFGSIGWSMRDTGYDLGITSKEYNDVAGKLMGLQSYGTLDYEYLEFLKKYDISQTLEIFSQDHWHTYKGDKLIGKLTLLDWIKTVHHRMGEVLVEFFKKYASPDDVIVYAGGVAQNVIWNTELKKHFPNLIIPPHSSDEGLSFGGLEWLRQKNKLPKFKLDNFPYVESDVAPSSTPELTTIQKAAKLLSEGKTVGWYQGHGEVGPRALGNRSILMDPRIVNGRVKINKIKNRENFRPFGASVLKECANTYFELDHDDEFMLYVAPVKTKEFEAITHIDNTCRVQTVGDRNPIFRQLLEEFYKLTGCPVLLNTSLNIAGKPIAGYPENAKELFWNSELDHMFIGNEHLFKLGKSLGYRKRPSIRPLGSKDDSN